MVTEPTTSKKTRRPFRVGQSVTVDTGTPMPAVIVEDLGNIGVRGAHMWRVRAGPPSDDPLEFDAFETSLAHAAER